MTTIDPTKLEAAKEWAEEVSESRQTNLRYDMRQAAEVILSLPDTIVDGDKLREVMEWFDRQPMGDDSETEFVQRLDALLPDPAPRTLADMTIEEREACQWMQANFDDGTAERPVRVVITKAGKTTADIILPEGAAHWVHVDKLTPLPSLPRMVWPDEHHPETTEVEEGTYGQARWEMVTDSIRGEKEYAIDAQDYDGAKRWRDVERALGAARGIDLRKEPSDLPRPEDVPAGEVWLIRPHENADPVPAFRVHASKYGQGKRWAHYRIGGNMLGFCDDEDVTLVSRLVTEEQA